MCEALLNKDPDQRLGSGPDGAKNVKAHPFFSGVDWDKVSRREVPPPWAPTKKGGAKDTGNFDEAFTKADPTPTPEDPGVIRKIGQMNHLFTGFSYVNPTDGAFKQEGMVAPIEATRANVIDLRRFAWYRPDIAREDMGKALKGLPTGSFFVRESSSQPGCYALSVATGGGKRWNGLITPTVDNDGTTKFRLYITHKFNSFSDLVQFYSKNAVTKAEDGREVFLLMPDE